MTSNQYANTLINQLYGQQSVNITKEIEEQLNKFLENSPINPDTFINQFKSFTDSNSTKYHRKNKVINQVNNFLEKNKIQDQYHLNTAISILTDPLINAFAQINPTLEDPNHKITKLMRAVYDKDKKTVNVQLSSSNELQPHNIITTNTTHSSTFSDVCNQHGLNEQQEINDNVIYETITNIQRNIIYKATKLDSNPDIVNLEIPPKKEDSNLYIVEHIVNKFLHLSQQIAINTRLGAANTIVVSPDIAAIMSTLEYPIVNIIKPNVNTRVNRFATMLDGLIEIYRDPYATDSYALLTYAGEQYGCNPFELQINQIQSNKVTTYLTTNVNDTVN